MTLKSTHLLLLCAITTACNGKDATDTDDTMDTGGDTDISDTDTSDTDDTSDTSDTSDTGDTSDTTDTGDTSDTGDTGDVTPEDLALSGNWTDNWGSHHTVDNAIWNSGWALYNISQYSNDDGWIIAQNDSQNAYFPELWSKFEWTTDADGEYYYCQTAYAEESEQAAVDVAAANAGDLESGCGGFAWTALRPYLSFVGSYDDEWGSRHVVSPFEWVSFSGDAYSISQYSNDDGWIVAQNSSQNAYFPDLWSKFEWTIDADGEYYYCQSTYAENTEAEAIAAFGADKSDLQSGCSGFSWTGLRSSLPISGRWVDEYSGTHVIDAWRWTTEYGVYHVGERDSVMGWLVAQNDANNSYNPDLWSKFEWTYDLSGVLYYCQSAYDQPDEASAVSAPNADMNDLVTGCFGFSWTSMTIDLE